ncbi:CNDP dipeptidase [Melanogaster broomeanus]|nr:CNDP dipeptidase [Melanogaster broomeanus]
MSNEASFFHYVDEHVDDFIMRLTDAVRFESISGDSAHREEVRSMGAWLQSQLVSLGVPDTRLVELGDQPGTTLKLPPLVFGRLGTSSSKKTVLVYGHYDVQPVSRNRVDGWAERNPDSPNAFALKNNLSNGELLGRGSTDDKGPLMGWLNVLEAHQRLGFELPVNIRFLFEGMEESSSVGLDGWIAKAKEEGLFAGVDCVCITDNYWLTTRRPALTYGVRGIAYFSLNITGAKDDLHSGIYGRMVHEPMTDMVKLLAKLVQTNGVITVPGVEALVDPPTDDEIKLYDALDYKVDDLRRDTGAAVEVSEDPAELLMGRMRYPSLSIHGIKGSFDKDGLQTIIPHQISGRFSLRLVYPQTPDIITPLVTDFLKAEFAKLQSKNTMQVVYEGGGLPWLGDRGHWNFKAADDATQAVHGDCLRPDYTREGGSIPVALVFEDTLKTNVLLLPMGRSDDGAHSSHEKLDTDNYIKGARLIS